jgi:M6 family metalloprotease-like protein/uncharacterized protein (TIGR03382 family)
MARRVLLAALCVATLSPLAARADFIDMWSDKTDMPVNKAPRVGASSVVLIPVQIDYTGPNGAYPAIDLDSLKAFYTAPATTNPSFAGYLQVASSGRYNASVTVAPLVRYDGCPTMLAANGCNIERGDVNALHAGMDFVRDVFRRAHDENKVDFSKFDTNGFDGRPDGYVDGAIIIVNTDIGITLPIEYVNNGPNLGGGSGGPLLLDGVKIPYVAIGGVSTVGGKPRFEFTALHEYGHLLGLDSLYYQHPVVGSDPWPNWQGLHFSLMGDYAYDQTLMMPDAESRRALGWNTLRLVSGTQTLTLKPAADGGFAVKLGQMNGTRKEYFLAEVRGPSGAYDFTTDSSGNPTWGLAIYHVDWSKGPKPDVGSWTSRLIECSDCNPFHPFIRNLESSDQWGLVFTGAKNSANNTKGESDDHILYSSGASLVSLPNPGVLSQNNHYTATNWYDGSDSGIRIENITVNVDHSVTATFTAPSVSDPCSDVVCAPLEACVTTGEQAGNCQAMQSSTDGGTFPQPPQPLPTPASSGCSTSGAAGAFALLPLALLAVLWMRRRRAIS